MTPKRRPHAPASLARRRRRLSVEQLENRTLPAAMRNVFALFTGAVSAGGNTQINVGLQNPLDFTLPAGKMELGFLLKAAGGSALDPDVVQVTQGGSAVAPLYANANLPGRTDSLALVLLGSSSYTLTVGGEHGSAGAFELDVFLPGDVDGSRTVDNLDGQLLKNIAAKKAPYDPAADVNQDGVVDSFDVAQWARNRNASTRINPLSLTVSLTPKQIPLADGTLLTNVASSSVSGTVASSSVMVALGSGGTFGTPVAVTNGHFSFPVTLAEGSNAYQVEATDGFGQQAVMNVPITLDTTPPTLQLTGSQPLATTHNLTLAGNVTDALSGVSALTAQVDSGAATAVIVGSGGSFSFSTSLPLDGSADGKHTVHLAGSDVAGNVVNRDVSFLLLTQPPATPVFDLSSTSITPAAVSAHQTAAARVTLVGQTEANVTVTLLQTGATTVSSNTGSFQFPNVMLALGGNPFTVQATDLAGNTSSFSLTITRVAATGQPNAVIAWNQAALAAIQLDASDPLHASRALAMVQAAVYDAVTAIDGTPAYYVKIMAPAGASAEAAVDAAAYTVLGYLYPAQQANFNALLTTRLAAVPAGQSQTDGLSVGQTVGNAIIALRAHDGYDTFVDFTPKSGPGQWQPTAPAYAEALDPQWATLTPFAMTSDNQFRPAGPPALTSQQWADAVNKTESLGSATSTTRTADQTQIAHFWSDGMGTVTPPGQWNVIAETVAQQQGDSLAADARLFAMLDVALGDASIVAWDAKYTYTAWRPITVIRNADQAGNPLVQPDPNWTPLLITPNFPEYVAGHSTFSATAAAVLDSYFGNNVSFSDTSAGFTRSFTSFDQAAAEAGESRIYGGIHFEFSNQDGQAAGRALANYVVQTFAVSTDTQPPKVSITAPLSGTVSATNTTITGQVTDNLSGVALLEVQIDGGNYAPLAFNGAGNFSLPTTFALNGSADGMHVFHFRATDAAGNVSTPLELDFTLDTLAPAVTVTSPAVNAALAAGVHLTGTASGTGSALTALSYAIDNGQPVPLSFDATSGAFDQALNLTGLTTGGHTLTVTARDAAGNTSTTNVAVTLPAAPPVAVTDFAPTDGATDVGATYRPKVTFSAPIDVTTLNANDFYATDTTGTKLAATIVPSNDGTYAWLFFTSAMPGASTIKVTVDGSLIHATNGAPIDAGRTGTAGSVLTFSFSTVSESFVPGTTLSGIVADPGPDLIPGTPDDVKPGPDGVLMTGDDVYQLPIAHVKVYILGHEDQAIYTDANGHFSFTSVPVGDVKLDIDGRTATNPPAGYYFPEMVMDLTIQPGVANTVMGSMGSTQQQAATAAVQGVYLPRVQSSILQTVSNTQTTEIGVNPQAATGLTPQQASELKIDIAPGSLIGMDGTKLTTGQVGISLVPPQLVMDMLPAGLMQHTFDITIQAPGVATFATPAAMTFPNVFHADPGTKLDFLSFDHTTGRLVIDGTATVSADGLTATTDPGMGITHPGWHGLTPPGGCGGSGGTPPAPLPPDSEATPTTETDTLNLITGEEATNFPVISFDAPPQNPSVPPLPPIQGCEVPPHHQGNQQPFKNYTIEIEGPLAQFMKPSNGGLPLVGQAFTLSPGSAAQQFGLQTMSFSELLGSGGFMALNNNRLYGSKITITEIFQHEDGSRTRDIHTYYIYRFVDATDDNHTDDRIAFEDAQVGVTRTKQIDIVAGTPQPTVPDPGAPFAFSAPGTVTFAPTSSGTFGDPFLGLFGGSYLDIQSPAGKSAGKIYLHGSGFDPYSINVNTAALKGLLTALANLPAGSNNAGNVNSLTWTDAVKTTIKNNIDTIVGDIVTDVGNLYTASGLTGITASANSGDVKVQWMTSTSWGSFGDSSPGGGIDSSALMQAVYAQRNNVSQSELAYRLAEALNQTRAGLVNVFAANHINWPTGQDGGSHLNLTQGEIENAIAYTVAHEAGHTFGLFHSAQLTGPDTITANTVETVTLTPANPTFTLTFNGTTSAALSANATAADVQAAMAALAGAGNVTVTGANGGPFSLTFGGALAHMDVAQTTAAGQNGETVATATTTNGSASANEVQTVTLTPANPLFTLTFDGRTTAQLSANATAAQVQTALTALVNIAAGNVVVTGAAGGPYTLTFGGGLQGMDLPQVTGAGLNGLMVATATTTHGSSTYLVGSQVGNTNDLTDIMTGGMRETAGTSRFQSGNSLELLKMGLKNAWTPAEAMTAVSYLIAGRSFYSNITDTPDGDNPTPIPGPSLVIRGANGEMVFDSLDFGTVSDDGPGGALASRTYTITNYGNQNLVLNQLAVSDATGSFSATAVAPGTVLAPRASLNYTITFDPRAAGPLPGTFTLSSNDPTAQTSIALTGSGVDVTPHATLQVGNNNLGGVTVGSGSAHIDQLATITNNGAQPLVISSIAFAEGGAAFTLTGVPANLATNPITLATGKTFSFGVTFSPDALGLRRALINVVTNDPAHPTLRLGAVGTGLANIPTAVWSHDYVALEMPNRAGAQPLRAVSDDKGNFSFFLPPNQAYHLVVFDPKTGLVAHGYGTTPPSGQGIDLTKDLAFGASTAPDTNGDGLPDDIKFAIGVSMTQSDTNHDGIDDFTSIQEGLNPLSGTAFPTGVIASLPLAGQAKAIVAQGSITDPNGQTLYVATGTAGLAVVNATQFNKPILLAQLSLPGNSADVAFDPLHNLAVVASGSGGLNLVDISNPAKPKLQKTVALAGGAQAVKVYDGLAYVASDGSVVGIDLATGQVVQTLALGGGTLTSLAREGTTLYSLDTSRVLRAIDISGPSMVAKGSLTLASSGGQLFVGNGVAYIGAGNGDQEGFSTADVSNPASLKLLSGVQLRTVGGQAVVANGSGLALAIGTPFLGSGSNSKYVPLLDVMIVSNPANTGALLTQINMPASPVGVAIASGIAYVADGTGGLQVVNYVPFDVNGVPPTVSISTTAADVDLLTPGLQVREGSVLPIKVNASDDVQVRKVELLVNGQVVQNNVSFPYDFSVIAPTIATAGNTFTIQVRATDTGGNVGLSNVLTVGLVADTSPPTISNFTPANGSSVLEGVQAVQVTFSKALAAGTVTTANFQLKDAGSNTITPAGIELRGNGTLVELSYVPLLAGTYQLVINGPAVTDLVGHALSTGNVTDSFTLTPRETLTVSNPDADPVTPGLQLYEGTTVHGTVSVVAGVTVQEVDVLLNGQVIDPIGGPSVFPFSFIAPLLSGGASSFTLQARVTDTSGVTTVSSPLTVGLLKDTTPPSIVGTTPASGSSVSQGLGTITVAFSKPIAEASVTAGNFQLIEAGPDGAFGDGTVIPINGVQFANEDTQVQVAVSSLKVGSYEFLVSKAGITDRPGNALGTGTFTSQFTVSPFTGVLLLGAEYASDEPTVRNALASTGVLGGAKISYLDTASSTPSLATLQQYSAVLVWTDYPPLNPTALGNVLAQYVDGGGGLVISTYSTSSNWALAGKIQTTGYDPFLVESPGYHLGGSGTTYHSLTSYTSSSPLFAGISGSPTYWTNSNYVNPPLSSGATLLGSDNYGNQVVAVNSKNNVVGITIYPGYLGSATTDPQVYRLFDNALLFAAHGQPQFLAGQPRTPAGGTSRVTQSQLQPVVSQAIADLAGAGYDVRALSQVQFHLTDLPDSLLGWTSHNTIWIDPTAQGYGWYTDVSPTSDAAFTQVTGVHELQAAPGSPAYGHVDLLTVVTHELGHVLGFASIAPDVLGHDWMTATLGTGVRRSPDAAAATAGARVTPPVGGAAGVGSAAALATPSATSDITQALASDSPTGRNSAAGTVATLLIVAMDDPLPRIGGALRVAEPWAARLGPAAGQQAILVGGDGQDIVIGGSDGPPGGAVRDLLIGGFGNGQPQSDGVPVASQAGAPGTAPGASGQELGTAAIDLAFSSAGWLQNPV